MSTRALLRTVGLAVLAATLTACTQATGGLAVPQQSFTSMTGTAWTDRTATTTRETTGTAPTIVSAAPTSDTGNRSTAGPTTVPITIPTAAGPAGIDQDYLANVVNQTPAKELRWNKPVIPPDWQSISTTPTSSTWQSPTGCRMMLSEHHGLAGIPDGQGYALTVANAVQEALGSTVSAPMTVKARTIPTDHPGNPSVSLTFEDGRVDFADVGFTLVALTHLRGSDGLAAQGLCATDSIDPFLTELEPIWGNLTVHLEF